MKTAHASGFSYLDFTSLWSVISAPDNWPLFEDFFPPSHISAAKIEEVIAIRNRVAHFRTPHRQDCDRLSLFVQDIEAGVREFCTRYSMDAKPSDEAAAVIGKLESNWEIDGYGTEMYTGSTGWLYAPEPYRGKPRWNAHCECGRMLGSTSASDSEIMRIDMVENVGEGFDLKSIFDGMSKFHDQIVHFTIFHVDQVGISIPVCLGRELCYRIIAEFFAQCRNNVGWIREPNLTRLVSEWPEFVLLPGDVLTNFHKDHDYAILTSA